MTKAPDAAGIEGLLDCYVRLRAAQQVAETAGLFPEWQIDVAATIVEVLEAGPNATVVLTVPRTHGVGHDR